MIAKLAGDKDQILLFGYAMLLLVVSYINELSVSGRKRNGLLLHRAIVERTIYLQVKYMFLYIITSKIDYLL